MPLDIRELTSHDRCMDHLGMDFVESWVIKVAAAENALVKLGKIKKRNQVADMWGMKVVDDDQSVFIQTRIKDGFLSTSKNSHHIPIDVYNASLNEVFPVQTAYDQSRIDAIREREVKRDTFKR